MVVKELEGKKVLIDLYISKYFDKKVKTPKYVEIPYSLTDKLTFIEEVLKSVV